MTVFPQPTVSAVNVLDATTAGPATDRTSVQSVATVTTGLHADTLIIVRDEAALYRWDPTSLAAPAAGSVILPGDVLVGDPGRWLLFAGGGGGGSLVGAPLPYVVQPAGSLPDLATAGWQNVFPTITAAITQAVADGHSVADPTTITVLPGVYTEDVDMQPGISVVGLGASQQLGADLVSIVGTVTMEASLAGASFLLENVTITGGITANLTTGSSILRKVTVFNAAGNAILVPVGGDHSFTCFDCTLFAIGAIACLFSGDGSLNAIDSDVQASPRTLPSVSASSVDCQVAGRGSRFGGRISLQATTGGNLELDRCTVSSEDNPAVEVQGIGGDVLLKRCDLTAEGDTSDAIFSDTTQIFEHLTVFTAARGVSLINGATLVSNSHLGNGTANQATTVAEVVTPGGGETLIAQVPFDANFQNDRLFVARMNVLPVSSATITYRVAFADSGGVDVENLSTSTNNEASTPRTYPQNVVAAVASPPLSAEAVMQSGSYNINLYATVAGSDVEFNGVAIVYGGSP